MFGFGALLLLDLANAEAGSLFDLAGFGGLGVREGFAGDERAFAQLSALMYEELRQLAQRHLRRERSNHTMQKTALVNEALLRLMGTDVSWQDRAHFYAVAALKMRSVLVDHARARGADKRGGDALMLTLSHAEDQAGDGGLEILALHEALSKLSLRDGRAARAIEMAYFGGMQLDEIACVLEVSTATVERDLKFARAWLNRQLG